MKKTVLMLLLSMAVGGLRAQTSSPQVLQNARNLVITTTNNQNYYYLVSSEQSHFMQRGDGEVTIGRDNFQIDKIRGMRFRALQRFSLNEDSTTIGTDYAVDHGLLALRRSLNTNLWNTLVLPFSLTGEQVQQAFGSDAMLAYARGVSSGDMVTIEFVTIPIDTDETVIEANQQYLIKPTREPDIAKGQMTSVAYGSSRLSGPVYLIPNVSMSSGQHQPQSIKMRTDDDQVRLRFSATFVQKEIDSGERDFYVLGDNGLYAVLNEPLTIKAFRTWLDVVRNDTSLPLRFYIDGINENITQGIGILPDGINGQEDNSRYYDLQGRSHHGVQRGITIVRHADGTTHKVLTK